MKKDIILKILNWTNFRQKKYKKNFKKYKIFSENNQIIEKNLEKDQNKVYDTRIYLGSLRYIPFSILSLLKNLPAPWKANNFLPLIIHENKSLLIMESNTNILPEFSSTLWNLIWVLNRKEKINRIFFQRVKFPIFDDEEIWNDLKILKNTNNSSLLISRNLEDYLKLWFCSTGNLVQNCVNINRKTLIYPDNSLKISFNKIEIQSGLYINRNSNHVEKYYKFLPTFFIFPKKWIFFENHLGNYFNKKEYSKSINENFLSLFPFFHQIQNSSIRKILKIEPNNNVFSFKISDKIVLSQIKNSKKCNWLKFLKYHQKKLFFETINKKDIFLFEMVTPLFLDIFFSQKRLSFYLKFRFDFSEVFSPFYFSVPAWNNFYVERVLINVSKLSFPNLSLSHLSLIKYLVSTTLKKKKKKGDEI
jgi:hypothetical protein